jgi:signal transduction histidine kinase
MIRVPRSLRGRLALVAAAATLVALAVAGVAIAGILDRYVTGTIDARLDDRLLAYGAAVREDGTLDTALLARLARESDQPWRIVTPRARAGMAWLDPLATGGTPPTPVVPPEGFEPPKPPPPPHPGRQPPPADRAPPPSPGAGHPFDQRTGTGGVHGRWATIPTAAGPARVAVAVPRRAITRPVEAALAPLLAMLALLGGLLGVATLVQLRLGLRPLATIAAMLAEVRAGRRRHVTVDSPTELLPLVERLNALIDDNAAQLKQARGHVANLAHGLKTPLATLRLDLAGHDPDGRLAAQLDRAERQIRHHLGRARAASDGPAGADRIAVAPIVADLVAALARIHADRGIRSQVAVADDMAVRCDAQDLAEILGNLIDNGWRWARQAVRITAERRDAAVRIAITDDGPGIAADAIPQALRPGVRLDEAGEGHGFGLPIARELAELHGGTLTLSTAPGGGLTATVTLPAG